MSLKAVNHFLPEKPKISLYNGLPSSKSLWRDNGVLHSALACCAGFDFCHRQKQNKMQYSDGFSSLSVYGGGERNGAIHYLRDLAPPCSFNATNNNVSHAICGEHSVSARNGKKKF